MTTRQFTIMFTKNDHILFGEVEPLLRLLFYKVEPHPEDFVILCRTNNSSVSNINVRTVLYEHWQYVDDIFVKVIPDEPIENLSEEFGFVTADKFFE